MYITICDPSITWDDSHIIEICMFALIDCNSQYLPVIQHSNGKRGSFIDDLFIN